MLLAPLSLKKLLMLKGMKPYGCDLGEAAELSTLLGSSGEEFLCWWRHHWHLELPSCALWGLMFLGVVLSPRRPCFFRLLSYSKESNSWILTAVPKNWVRVFLTSSVSPKIQHCWVEPACVAQKSGGIFSTLSNGIITSFPTSGSQPHPNVGPMHVICVCLAL